MAAAEWATGLAAKAEATVSSQQLRDFVESPKPVTPTAKRSGGKARKNSGRLKGLAEGAGDVTPSRAQPSKPRRTKAASPGLQNAMRKATADAEAKHANATAAAELAAAEAAKAHAQAEQAERALAAYLASDPAPAALAVKTAMESKHCTSLSHKRPCLNA